MKRSTVFIGCLVLLLSAMMGINVSGDDDHVQILIIHSYHIGYQWTADEDAGIRESLLEAYPDAAINTEFLDWKRYPDQEVINNAFESMKVKYLDMDFDLVLTTDDRALEYAIDYRDELFPGTPIVFGGIIDHAVPAIVGDAKDITGVYEKFEYEGFFDIIRMLQPEVNEIIYLHDMSESGIGNYIDLVAASELEGSSGNHFKITNWSHKTYETLLEDLGDLPETSVVAFISYASSRDGLIKPRQSFLEEYSQASSVPFYSVGEQRFGYGVLGGNFLSGSLQGEQVGSLAIRILQGEDPDEIAYVSNPTVYLGVDEAVAKRFNVNIDRLPDEVTVINEEFSFFDSYRVLVITVAVIIIVLMIFIAILLRLLQVIKESNNELIEVKGFLEYESRHDFLTMLPNRMALEEHIKERLERHIHGAKLCIFYLDLDNFKFINNTYGHHFGDKLLINVGQRLKSLHDRLYVARIGGDEFVAVYESNEKNLSFSIAQMSARIESAVAGDMVIEDEEIKVTTSIGYSVYPDDGKDFEQLLIEADMAMYQAKKEGKSAIKGYEDQMSDAVENDYLLISNIKHGLKNDEFYLVYQPIIRIDHYSDETEVVGFEALVRWESEELGFVRPDKFIYVAESSGLIIPLGEKILDMALDFGVQAVQTFGPDTKISINVSVVQFYEGDFADLLLQRIKQKGLAPENVQLEITESIMIETYNMMIDKISYLKSKGVSIALDDFGTGYSSLAYLRELPLDYLKIDKSFVDRIHNEGKGVLVNAAITLAEQFGLSVVAEGVEEMDQVVYLSDNGCDLIQGYYFAKPMKDVEALAYQCQKSISYASEV